MAIFSRRETIVAVQWDPEDKQSLEGIKALVDTNPGLGWRVSDNLICDGVVIYNVFGQQVMRIKPYHYLVEGKRDNLFTVPPETFELLYKNIEDI